MIFRTGQGWQTTTADLALILFLVVTAAGTGVRADRPQRVQRPATVAAPTPLAGVYRSGDSETLTAWLGAQAIDDRQVATVLVRHDGTAMAQSMERGLAYLAEIDAAGREGRLVLEQGASEEILVLLTYDESQEPGTALADG